MWDETDSAGFIKLGAAFVPDRDLQLEIICDLLPDPKLAIDLCCGEGLLSSAILRRFPGCRVIAYDGSGLMLERTRSRNIEGPLFDLADTGWREFAEKPDAVASSLAIHHLDGAGKRKLYADMFRQIRPGGVLVVADLIEPASEAAREIAARQWDVAVGVEHREAFERERWNLYRYPDPETDKPSGLLDQLCWLREIGYVAVDVVYLRAGHAIFTGRIPF